MADNPALTERPETSIMAVPDTRTRGIAPIKAEYLVNPKPIVEGTSAAALNAQLPTDHDDEAEGETTTVDARDSKRRKTNDGKKDRGQNKARQFPVVREAGTKICRAWETTGSCDRKVCKYAHDWSGYFEGKYHDVPYNPTMTFSGDSPFVQIREVLPGGGAEDTVGKTIDLNTTCPVLQDLGYCPFGWRCRFLGGHVRKVGTAEEGAESEGTTKRIGEWELLGEKEEEPKAGWRKKETNWPDFDALRKLRSNVYDFPLSSAYLAKVEPDKAFTLSRAIAPKPKKAAAPVVSEEEAANEAVAAPEEEALNAGMVDGESEAIDVPLRPEEKRRLNWENGLYLAPLTTVGNLPFRRLCVDYGATITCSEMALAQPLVSGQTDEWALVRRHESEKMFGVQLAGGYPNRMVPTAEMLAKEVGSGVDFVDVNLGCPIDLVFNQGAGSALMDNPGRLGKILVGMNRALGEVPLTVKFRTGVASNKSNAHKLIPRFATEWGASAMTLHGRSRQQRYTKEANWEYIRTCATTLREHLADAGQAPVPIFGNGDCFSAHSYYEEKERSGVDGVMVARGALIKPWIFTEIAERREWDITATERLEGIKKFAEFGLSHWGSDTQGINTTRRFLCEALSFQHRYIPIGLLEHLPARMNDRPPAFKGRNELETLLSSPFSGDWVKISELVLGKVGDEFKFVPKHKSNAYGAEEAQG